MIEFTVNDMTCGHCASTITKAVKEVDAASRCEIDLGQHPRVGAVPDDDVLDPGLPWLGITRERHRCPFSGPNRLAKSRVGGDPRS